MLYVCHVLRLCDAVLARLPMLASPLHADLRSLAAFRVCLGLILATETVWLLPRAEALLSNAGVLPLQALEGSLAPHTQFWSLHRSSGGVMVQQLLLLAQLAAAACLAIGYRSRLAALCGWALFNSVVNRNPLMSHGGDTLLRMELLLAAFAPIAARWSLDACTAAAVSPLASGGATEQPARSLGVSGLLLQPVLMYAFAGALKFFPEWRDPASGFSAVRWHLPLPPRSRVPAPPPCDASSMLLRHEASPAHTPVASPHTRHAHAGALRNAFGHVRQAGRALAASPSRVDGARHRRDAMAGGVSGPHAAALPPAPLAADGTAAGAGATVRAAGTPSHGLPCALLHEFP